VFHLRDVAFSANEETWLHFRVAVCQNGFVVNGKFLYAVLYKIVLIKHGAFRFILK
jgi:hypothetical protein